MANASFIEFVFPQFSPQNWQSGVTIYHSGGVQKVSLYGELVSARVRAGIGETYDVRLKLHAGGKFVQWMECSCQANRRRGEKCQHISALCIHLDQDEPKILLRMNLGTDQTDRFLNYYSRAQQAGEAGDVRALFGGEPAGPQGKAPPTRAEPAPEPGSPFGGEENLQALGMEVVSIEPIEGEPLLLLTMQSEAGRRVSYRLGVDDAFRLLISGRHAGKIGKKVAWKDPSELHARRFFDIRKHGKQGIRITKSLVLADAEGRESKVYAYTDPALIHRGRLSALVKKIGYVGFNDSMSPTQIIKWEEYPAEATLGGDTVATLFETNFDRLRETAEVRLAPELKELSVAGKLDVSKLKVKSTATGELIVETVLAGLLKPGAGEDEAPAKGGKAAGGGLLDLLRARAEGRQYVATKDGWLKVSEELDWLQSKLTADGKLKLSTLEFIKFREQFAGESQIVGQEEVVKRIKQGLVASKDLEMPSLGGTRLALRPYQEDGVRWLWWLYSNALGGLLADEMGLGKTHQAMALLSVVARAEPKRISLVVCPTSVIDHWLDKMRSFIPGVRTICYHGTGRRQEGLKNPQEHVVIVTSYGILLRDILFLMQCPLSVVVLDEAHLVKNQTTRTYRAACKLSSRMRLCLTGTPLENDLMELKNLFDYIAPNYLGGDADFKRKYMSNTQRDPVSELELKRMIHPFKLRRNKRDVLLDLPEKVEDIRHCPLKREQRELYAEALALKGSALVDQLRDEGNGPIPYVHVFSLISLLKQICDDPGLIDPRYAHVGSGKLDLFDELLREALESEQKVVVFSQYARMIQRLSERLDRQGVRHVTLTGSSTNRGAIVREFQENTEVKVFLGSLLAGGTGIDLTAGSVVIHFDRWWNAAKENQATDRIHRIGQGRNVQVYKLVTKGTLEEKIDEIINRKRIIFDRFVEEDAEVFKHLSREDLLNLLAPPSQSADLDSEEREEPLPPEAGNDPNQGIESILDI